MNKGEELKTGEEGKNTRKIEEIQTLRGVKGKGGYPELGCRALMTVKEKREGKGRCNGAQTFPGEREGIKKKEMHPAIAWANGVNHGQWKSRLMKSPVHAYPICSSSVYFQRQEEI